MTSAATNLAPEVSPSIRRFGLADLMILIAGVAMYVALLRGTTTFARLLQYLYFAPGMIRYLILEGPRPSEFVNWRYHTIRNYLWETPLRIIAEALMPLPVPAPLLVILWRLVRPRPGWRGLVRQPGFVACLATLMGCVVVVDLGWIGFGPAASYPLAGVGMIVLGAWLVQAFTRSWRPEPGLIDRAGRAVGLGWIALGLVTLF